MGIPKRLLELLNAGKVRYEILHHPEAFTAQELAAIEHVPGRSHAKVVVVKAGDELLMTVLPADRRVDLAKLGTVIGRPATLAVEDDFKIQFADCATGTMPPLGQLYGVTTYLDRSLATADSIVFEAGTHSDAVKMKFADYQRLAKPIIAEFTTKTS